MCITIKVIRKQFNKLFTEVYIPMDVVADLDVTNRYIFKEVKKDYPDFCKVDDLADDVRNIIADLLCDDSYSSTERKAFIKYAHDFNQFIRDCKSHFCFTKVFCI